MPADGAGEDHAFEIAPPGDEVFDLVAMRDADYVLLDDGAVVEQIRNVVAGSADELDAARVRCMVGLGAGERGQKRVVHVDDGHGVMAYEARRQHLHIPRQHHQVHLVRGEDFELPGFGCFAVRGVDRNEFKGNAVEASQLLHVAMVGDDHRDLACQFAGPPAVKQVGHAVQILRAEERHTRQARTRTQLPAHTQLSGEGREGRLESG